MGDAAIAWQRALGEWRRCSAQSAHVGGRERYHLLRRADRAADGLGPLRDAFEHLAAPERARLRAELPEAKKLLDDLEGRHCANLHFGIAHPEALRRLERLDDEIAAATWELDVERQGLDGIAPMPLPGPRHERGIELEGPVLERGIERGIELGIGR